MAGVPLAVGVVVAVALSGSVAFTAASAASTARQLGHAADAAALAAADVALGWAPGAPCAVAEKLTETHGVELSRCDVDGLEVRVTAQSRLLGVVVERSARAGPP